MAAPTAWTLTNGARTDILNGNTPFGSGSFKLALFTSTSNVGVASTTYAGLTNEVTSANGYTTGGIAVTFTLAGTTSVTVKFSSNPVWTASSAGITARFAALYKVSGNVITYFTLDSTPADVSVSAGNTLTVDGITNAILTLA